MAAFFLGFVGMVAGGLALVVYVCALPFLLKDKRDANRFGAPSSTRTFGQAIVGGLVRSFDFAGRANRMDFWTFAVFTGLVCAATVILTVFLLLARHEDPMWFVTWLLLIIPLMAIPSLSMAVRRLHDVNRSAWWLLLLLVFGYFILLFWFFQPGQAGVRETAELF